MKILKKGKLPTEKTYQTTCHNCQTEFEFARKEAKFSSDQREGDFLTINCPLCAKAVSLSV